MTTTPMLTACSQKPISNEYPQEGPASAEAGRLEQRRDPCERPHGDRAC